MRHPGRPGILNNAKPRTEPRHFATVRAGSLVMTTKGMPLRGLTSFEQYLPSSNFYRCLGSPKFLCWSFPGSVVFGWLVSCGDLPIGSRSSNIGLEASMKRCTRSVNIEKVHYMSSFCSFRELYWIFIEFKVDIIGWAKRFQAG